MWRCLNAGCRGQLIPETPPDAYERRAPDSVLLQCLSCAYPHRLDLDTWGRPRRLRLVRPQVATPATLAAPPEPAATRRVVTDYLAGKAQRQPALPSLRTS